MSTAKSGWEANRDMAGKKKVTLESRKPGQKAISLTPGGLHESLGVPAGKDIPTSKMKEALSGKKGKKANGRRSLRRMF